MFNYLKLKWMAFKDIFKDKNDINEKSIVGFAAFVIMVLFAIADLALGLAGKDFVVNETIYNSFVWVVLGAFGIAEAGKAFGQRNSDS